MNMKPLLCSACGERIGHIDDCDHVILSDFYCEDCAATFTAIEPIAIGSLIDHAKELFSGEVTREQVEQKYPSAKGKA